MDYELLLKWALWHQFKIYRDGDGDWYCIWHKGGSTKHARYSRAAELSRIEVLYRVASQEGGISKKEGSYTLIGG